MGEVARRIREGEGCEVRVYQGGKIIPMPEVTWGIMCSLRTLVTTEDPDVPFNDSIKKSAQEAPQVALKALGVDLEG